MENITEQKRRKTFKDYYSDPEYKQRHKEYLMQKVQCECGCTYLRSNSSHHKQTQKHKMIILVLLHHANSNIKPEINALQN